MPAKPKTEINVSDLKELHEKLLNLVPEVATAIQLAKMQKIKVIEVRYAAGVARGLEAITRYVDSARENVLMQTGRRVFEEQKKAAKG